MVDRLEGMPEGTLGFRASGRIEPSDSRDVLEPALRGALEGGGAWKRSAIVTDISWMAHATRLFAWMLPGEARVFTVSELEDAKRWVAG